MLMFTNQQKAEGHKVRWWLEMWTTPRGYSPNRLCYCCADWQVCCSCCVLGLRVRSEGRGCDGHQHLGYPCGHIFLTCCEEGDALSLLRRKQKPRPTALPRKGICKPLHSQFPPGKTRMLCTLHVLGLILCIIKNKQRKWQVKQCSNYDWKFQNLCELFFPVSTKIFM